MSILFHKPSFNGVVVTEDVLSIVTKIFFHEVTIVDDALYEAPHVTHKNLFYKVTTDVDILSAIPLSVKITCKQDVIHLSNLVHYDCVRLYNPIHVALLMLHEII